MEQIQMRSVDLFLLILYLLLIGSFALPRTSGICYLVVIVLEVLRANDTSKLVYILVCILLQFLDMTDYSTLLSLLLECVQLVSTDNGQQFVDHEQTAINT
ncbi:hypothetical protein PMAYCL1PPCAC_25597, partial [Pristionchus mayeri]